jgi:hypothetical protein
VQTDAPPASSLASQLGCLGLATLLLALPVAGVMAALAWFDVVPERTAMWVSGLSVVAAVAFIAWAGSQRVDDDERE